MKVKVSIFDWDSAVLVRSVGVIAGKWKVEIICHLFGGTKRFSELRRLLAGVHRGTLTYELRGRTFVITITEDCTGCVKQASRAAAGSVAA